MKHNKLKLAVTMISLLILPFCSVKKDFIEVQSGKYQIKISKSNNSRKPVIFGTMYAYEDSTLLQTNGFIKIGDSIKCRTDVKGNFKFNLEPGNYKLIGVGYPYEVLTTSPIKIQDGDSVKVFMYLKTNTKPMIN